MKQSDFETAQKAGKVTLLKPPTPAQAPQPAVSVGDISRQLETYFPFLEKIRLGALNPSTFGGNVVSGAAGTLFPSGWTVTHTSTGVYTITHNLNTTAYAVVITLVTPGLIAAVTSRAANSFQVSTENLTPAAANGDFDFILTK